MDAAALADGDDDVATLVAKQLADETVEPLVARLDAAGVPCERVVEEPYMPEFLWDEWGSESGRIFEQHHAHARLDPRGRPDDPPVRPTRAATRARARCSASTAGRSWPRSASAPDEIEALIGTVVKVAERGGDDE